MAPLKDQFAAPGTLVPPGVKSFLEESSWGRFGLRAGRKIIQFLRNSRDPLRRKIWMSQITLPLRNAILLNRPVKISLEGVPVLLSPQGSTATDIWMGVRCESHEASFILSVLEPGMNFFDVGANAGLFTISAAKKIGGNRVYAFEPCSSTCELLKRNLLLNQISDVNVMQLALGDSVGDGVLQINARGKDGLNTLGQATHPDSQVVSQEGVRITTLDHFLTDRNISRVDVMKVDIEGAELMMFRGARNLLMRADAPVILYEGFGSLSRGFGYHPVEILWLLESCGYALFLLSSETGEISELKPDYRYDSMMIAIKPSHSAFENLRQRVK